MFESRYLDEEGNVKPNPPEFKRDIRCAMALGSAIAHFIQGVLNWKKDQLDAVLEKCWKAQEMSYEDDFV